MAAKCSLSRQIWEMKYRLKTAGGAPVDQSVDDTWRRVARSLASVEKNPPTWEAEFHGLLRDFKFLPAGRIIAGAGAGRRVTLFNCFVMGAVPDDMGGIFGHLREAALTLQQGGGIGYDFSTLRPKGSEVRGSGSDASGPLSFMDVWDAMCRTIMSAGSRRGAMMATLRCDHPDIETFVEAKREPGRLTNFNLSVLVTDSFMDAVRDDAPWPLWFGGTVARQIQARTLWDQIMRATYDTAEPGVIFIDRINRSNNLHYCESISATNPCGEQPLPPYGACLLGSVNLAALVARPFTDGAALDTDMLAAVVGTAVRFLDNAIDVSRFPLAAQAREAAAKRRIGLGITGLADALLMCRTRYGGVEAVRLLENWMAVIRRAAYRASVALAREKGPFPLFDAEAYLAGNTVRALDADLRRAIRAHGIRNALLTSIAPTGTISLFADNVSSGMEPVFAFSYARTVTMPDGSRRQEDVSDHAYRRFRALFGEDAALPDYFVDAQTLMPEDHLVMQAAAQTFVDSAISKTINLPVSISFKAFKDVYRQAYDLGCKGCTTYRPTPVRGSVLSVSPAPATGTTDGAEDGSGSVHRAPAATDSAAATDIVHIAGPLSRPAALSGRTYKLGWPGSDHALYITLNDIVQDGRRRPFEIFVNSKNMEHYAWTVALTRMISAVFRRGGDVSFVVKELKAVFDPRGGAWIGGRYVPSLLELFACQRKQPGTKLVWERNAIALFRDSMIAENALELFPCQRTQPGKKLAWERNGMALFRDAMIAKNALAAIGDAIERHLRTIDFLPADAADDSGSPGTSPGAHVRGDGGPVAVDWRFGSCPRCGQPTLTRQEGCDLCAGCGYSRCG